MTFMTNQTPYNFIVSNLAGVYSLKIQFKTESLHIEVIIKKIVLLI